MIANAGGSSTQKTEIPDPSPSEMVFRRLFLNTIMPTMMGMAGFSVKKRKQPLFLGYASADKNDAYNKGEIEAWTGKPKSSGSWENVASTPAPGDSAAFAAGDTSPSTGGGGDEGGTQRRWVENTRPVTTPTWEQLQERFG